MFTSPFKESLSYPISFCTLIYSLSEGSPRKAVMCLLQLICILSLIFSFTVIYLKGVLNTQKQVPLDIQLVNVSISCIYCVFPWYLFNKLFFCLTFSALVLLMANEKPLSPSSYLSISSQGSVYQVLHCLRNLESTIITFLIPRHQKA